MDPNPKLILPCCCKVQRGRDRENTSYRGGRSYHCFLKGDVSDACNWISSSIITNNPPIYICNHGYPRDEIQSFHRHSSFDGWCAKYAQQTKSQEPSESANPATAQQILNATRTKHTSNEKHQRNKKSPTYLTTWGSGGTRITMHSSLPYGMLWETEEPRPTTRDEMQLQRSRRNDIWWLCMSCISGSLQDTRGDNIQYPIRQLADYTTLPLPTYLARSSVLSTL